MTAHIITIKDHPISENAAHECIKSSWSRNNEFKCKSFKATTPVEAEQELVDFKLKWNYPWEGSIIDLSTGLTKSAYKTRNQLARVACSLSHFKLWVKCFEIREPIIVCEHDAIWTNKLPLQKLLENRFHIIGINNPLGATRRSRQYHDTIQSSLAEVQEVPWIDEKNIPQGLAGNSAYILKPEGAEALISAAYRYGLWPNDALMCKQLIRNLGVTRTFYTGLQKTLSTTT